MFTEVEEAFVTGISMLPDALLFTFHENKKQEVDDMNTKKER